MVIRAAQEASVLGAESPSTSKEVQDLYEVQFAGLNSRVGKRKGLSNPEVNLYTHTGLFSIQDSAGVAVRLFPWDAGQAQGVKAFH